jgi:hypothetical protein
LKARTRPTLKVAADQAVRALHALVAEGKIKVHDVISALRRREAMISELRKRLAALEAGAVSAGTRIGRTAKRRLTAERRAALKLHGQYLGLVRPLSKTSKAKIKAIRKKSGVRAAISAARKMGKK